MRILLLFTISILITACQSSPNKQEISQIVGEVISECSQADVCPQIPIDADKNSQVGEVEIIDPETAKVIWEWEWGEDLRQKYEITVLYEDQSWQPAKVVLIEQVRREEVVVDVTPEVKVKSDPNLLVNADYVVQFGSNGSRLIVKEIDGINQKSQNERIVLDTVTADPTDWVIMKGELTEDQIKGDVTRLVRDYFQNFQAGHMEGLLKLAPDAINYNYQAEFYLTDFKVALPENIKIESDQGQPKRAKIESEPISEPFTLTTQVPIKITYSLFGLEFVKDEALTLTWSRQQPRWTMPFWGVTHAVTLDKTYNFGENVITLDGVATTHEQTLVALTMSRNIPTTIGIYEKKEDLLLKLPRAYKWIDQLPSSKEDELMISIESGGIKPKTLRVDLNQGDPPVGGTGVQGKVEWGPTCGNPSSENSADCGNVPYQAKLTVTSLTGLIVATATSDHEGLYRIKLPPGQYVLIPESNEFMPESQIKFTVNEEELTYIPIIYDSMIP